MRKSIFGVLAALAVLSAPASAMAAGSPTVVAGAATKIGQVTAMVNGTVNPRGSATTYQFEYGTTTALGSFQPVNAPHAGAGVKPVAVHARLTGLTPDTTYYYELVSGNADGNSTTPISSFTTTGNPPPTATTGPASSVQRDRATFTGTVNPNNQTTSYYFRWGLSTSYGFQTAAQTVPAGSAPVPVSFTAIGLTPGYTFHYELVASHGGGTTVVIGADSSFETQPYPRPQAALHSYLAPQTIAHHQSSYTYNVHGSLAVPSSTPASLYCTGSVRVRIYAGSKRLSSMTTPVQSDCTYSATQKLTDVPSSSGKQALKVFVYYEGAAYGGPSSIHQLTAYAG